MREFIYLDPKIILDDDSLYCVKSWKPFYVLDNGMKIEWERQIYHKI